MDRIRELKFVDGEKVIVETRVDPQTVEDVKAERAEARARILASVVAEASRRLEAMASAYDRTERETWPVQIGEANALQADPNAPAPMLRALAGNDQAAVMALADKVLQLSNAFAATSGAIMRARNLLLAMDPIPADYADDKHWP
jgi:hypothetical protein